VLRKAVGAGESVYLPDDVHWNAAGHRVVAAAVAERLRQIVKFPAGTMGSLK
jgi:lysophospholipase L1-like esterase